MKRIFTSVFLFNCLIFAQQSGFSYWWQSDGLIDYYQMLELNALDSDKELWCALAELYVGKAEAEAADCIFEDESKKKTQKTKKIIKASFSSGANVDSSGNLINKSIKLTGRIYNFNAEIKAKENKDFSGIASFRHNFFYIKGGNLTSKHKGILSELKFNDFKLGGEWLFRNNRDSSWIYGNFNKTFAEKKIYTGANFRMIAPYYKGNKLYSRSWQGMRFLNWNLRLTEIASVKEKENVLDFIFLLERKKKGARLAFDFDKNKSRISAGVKPFNETDSLWARAEYPLRLTLGHSKKNKNIKVSNYFLFKESYKQGKPLEFRSESKIKIPIFLNPVFTLRWATNIYNNSAINLKQLYIELATIF